MSEKMLQYKSSTVIRYYTWARAAITAANIHSFKREFGELS